MKIVIDSLDIKKYDDEIDRILKHMTEDIIRICKKNQDELGVSDSFTITQSRYLMLKTAVVLSQSVERKIMNLIDDCDRDILEGMKE